MTIIAFALVLHHHVVVPHIPFSFAFSIKPRKISTPACHPEPFAKLRINSTGSQIQILRYAQNDILGELHCKVD
jgi:hypothetical protein